MRRRELGAPASRRMPGRALAALALLIAFSSNAVAGLDTSGRWTDTWNWGYTAVHLMLVPPGTSGYHSRIVWWEDRHDTHAFLGGMWGWTSNSSLDCSDSAGTSFTSLSMGSNVPASDVFCAGHIPLKSGTGKLFVSGGTEHGEVGIKNTNLFDPDASGDKWASGVAMDARRWYPTNTRLSDGTILVSSGSKYSHEWIYGGRTTGGTALNVNLRRLGLSLGGDWDAAISTSDDPSWVWPPALEGHVMLAIDSVFTIGDGFLQRTNVVAVMFGGDTVQTSTGKRTSVGLAYFPRRNPKPLSTDYGYYFQGVSQKFVPDSLTSSSELPRSDHTMTSMARDDRDSASVFVFGGRRLRGNLSAQNLSDVWRLYWHHDLEPAKIGWTWQRFTPSGGPSARFGHSAVLDPFHDHRRILIFGGTSDSSSAADNTVYALDVSDPRSPTWSSTTVTGAPPHGRFGHRMLLEPIARKRVVAGDTLSNQYGALLYGGKSADSLESTVYILWMNTDKDSLRLEWQQLVVRSEVGGSLPSGRVFHTLIKDELNDRWLAFGGDGPGSPDKRGWALRYSTSNVADTVYWRQMDSDADLSVTHASGYFSPEPIYSRIPEHYAVDGASKASPGTGPGLLQDWYPFQWVLPDSSLFTIGTGDLSYRATSLSGSWVSYPSDDTVRIDGGSAVMYAPGRILTAGTRDTKGVANASPDSRYLDTGTDTQWQASANTMHYGRTNLNLVALPNGQVLAVGGTQGLGGATDTAAARIPELWDPASHSWSGYNTLAHQAMIRDYHSTALLLPDGRILSAGGNSTANTTHDLYKAEIFCPPYLFKSDGNLAPRPVVTGAPDTIRIGHTFTVCTSDTSIMRISLIAPGAPTHAFDENERFIPLSFTKAPYGTARYLVTAPSGTGIAPPGPYLLFLTGARDGGGTGTLYPDVPSVAKWVEVIPDTFTDLCDALGPAITTPSVDVVGSNYVDIYWSAPADDSLIAASGPASSYDVRYNTSAINTETAWSSASQGSGEPAPDVVSTSQSYELGGLSSSTWYYLCLRAMDDDGLRSMIHGQVKFKTTVGGGGFALRKTPDRTALSRPDRPATESSVAPNDGSDLVIESAPEGGGWMITVRRVSELAEIGTSDAGSIVLQSSDGGGGWITKHRTAPQVNGGSVGYCAIESATRGVLAGGFGLDAIAPVIHTAAGDQALVSAFQSGVGALNFTEGEAIAPSIAIGDTVTLHYAAGGAIPEWNESWVALATPPSGASSSRLRPGQRPSLPLEFALGQNVPNPFRAATVIPFALPHAASVKIEIFDLFGRHLRTLVDRAYPAGRYSAEWDCRDDGGRALRSGVFAYRMTAGSFTARRKLVLVGR